MFLLCSTHLQEYICCGCLCVLTVKSAVICCNLDTFVNFNMLMVAKHISSYSGGKLFNWRPVQTKKWCCPIYFNTFRMEWNRSILNGFSGLDWNQTRDVTSGLCSSLLRLTSICTPTGILFYGSGWNHLRCTCATLVWGISDFELASHLFNKWKTWWGENKTDQFFPNLWSIKFSLI